MFERVFVLGDNIDTDQIITAEYMKINPASPDGYEQLGSLAFCGLPNGNEGFINQKTGKSDFGIVLAGKNFGCGSSREHAPIALAASGIRIVIASSFARIFFRNCINTGTILPVEVDGDLNSLLHTGDEVSVDIDNLQVLSRKIQDVFTIKPMGIIDEVVKAGGLFQYARQLGHISV